MRRRIAVVDHGMGNLRSVAKALAAAGGDIVITAEPTDVERSDALCVPGQGIFGRCVDALRDRGLDDVIHSWIEAERPYLGICLGMQVLFGASEERGPVNGLGILQGKVTKLPANVPVPHIGWNVVGDDYFYFDHSYAVHPDDETIVSDWCEHGERFAAAISTGPIIGVQFHPEKSSAVGIDLLSRWLAA